MSETNHHKDYMRQKPLVKKVRDCIAGQEAIQAAGELYLKKTSGMVARGDSGNNHYESYKENARFPSLVQDTENGIMGLAYKTEPKIKVQFETVTNNGRGAEDLSRSQLREVLETGRGVMVVDAPINGGKPYITEYRSESLINWAVADDDDSKLVAAKIAEEYFEVGDVYKTDAKTRYREYLLIDGRVELSLKDERGDLLEDEIPIPLSYIPIFTAGSVDSLPDVDPIPLLPVAHCAIAMYRISADYNQFIRGYGQGTPYATGITTDERSNILSNGLGVGAFLSAESTDAKFGMLESSQGQDETFIRAIEQEKRIAEQYAVAITSQGSGIEAAESLKLRAATKHASVYTILNSLSGTMTDAINCMAEWDGKPTNAAFELISDFTSVEASSQLITALQGAISAESLPVSVLRNVARLSGYTELTDAEMDAEILDGGGVAETI